jgi:hypothetical protein
MMHSVKNYKYAAFKKYPYPRSNSVGKAYKQIVLYKGNISAYTVYLGIHYLFIALVTSNFQF